MRKLLALLGLAVVGLAIAVAAKTVLMPSRQLVVAAVTPVAVDAAAAAGRLGAAVRFRTIASANDGDANGAEFDGLHALLLASFPRAHALLQREAVGKYGLLHTWPGSDPKAPPIALMAHQDVVPIAPGTEGDWKQTPFSGAVEDGFIWGRGSWDDKGNLMSITEGVLAGLARPTAFVGVAEKGYVSVQLTASATGGHSSMPPPEAGQSAIGMLSVALARLETSQMPLAIRGLARETFETIAPEKSGANRVFLSNLWLFGPLMEQQLKKSASGNATLRTTTALTIVRAGNADNVLPGRATATVNSRLLPGDSSDAVVEHVTQVVANPAIRIEKAPVGSEASRLARTDAPGYRLISETVRQLHPDTIVAPGLMIGATDSRHFETVADDIYKFSPVRAKVEDLKRFHGGNERISTANYVELIQFYHRLLSNAQPAL